MHTSSFRSRLLAALRSKVGRVLRPVLFGMVLLLCVRYFWVAQMRLPAYCSLPGLCGGDRVLVNLTSYGLRLPGEALWGYHRLGSASPQRGHYVAYRMAPTAPIGIGICRALPADTLWYDVAQRRVLLTRRLQPTAEAMPSYVLRQEYCLEIAPGQYTLIPHEALIGRIFGKLFTTTKPGERAFKLYAPLP